TYCLNSAGKKIGELESECGVSIGYISRMSKDEKAKPGIDFILNAAEVLNVSVDTLLFADLGAMSPTETYLIAFIDKLTKDTEKHELDWQVETPNMLNRMCRYDDGSVWHPLFSFEEFYEEGETEYPEHMEDVRFVSNAFSCNTFINGNCYNLRLKNGATIYLMDICKSVHRKGDKSAFVCEFWITGNTGNQFLCDNKGDDYLSKAFDNLFARVRENMKHPRIKDNLKYSIDAFMKGDITDDEKKSIPTEDDLPF
ncbi:MAG: helix-turn-helix transcriptional regulator, partial [Clostridia bacterium]|nr:helix-turn-helix transcriptional regulator [Clostridia bacterium]